MPYDKWLLRNGLLSTSVFFHLQFWYTQKREKDETTASLYKILLQTKGKCVSSGYF